MVEHGTLSRARNSSTCAKVRDLKPAITTRRKCALDVLETVVSEPEKIQPSDSSTNAEIPEPLRTELWPPSTAQTFEQWGEEVCRRMEELSRNEALRRKVCRNLS